MKKNKRVLVAMSGGVDSSVAASLLVDQGYEVIGATMQVWDYSQCEVDQGNGSCCSSLDVDDARSVADKLDIPFYVINCESQFREKVIDPFIQDYLKGYTPLPCVNCNTFLKFDYLIRKMKELDCDYLATGHYAQIISEDLSADSSTGRSDSYFIKTSEDKLKDQTYFLFTIDPEIIPNLLFPIGNMKKSEVRDYAARRGLVVAHKKDSTGICFVGSQGYGNFIESELLKNSLNKNSSQLRSLARKGFLKRYPSGEILGEHSGIHHFTYGQSKGLGLNHHEKLFVIKVDPIECTVWVGDEEYLYGDQLWIKDLHEFSEIKEDETYQIKIRYQHAPAPAKIKQDGSRWLVTFQEKQRAITPGQAAVIYQEQKLVGGGWVTI